MLRVIRSLLSYMRPYKMRSFLFFIALFLDLAFISLAPLSFKFIIDKAIVPQDLHYFTLIILVLVVFGIIGLTAGVFSDYLLAGLNVRIQRDLKHKLFKHIQRINMGYFQRSRSGDVVSYFSVDLPAVEGAMSMILTTGIQSAAVVIITTAVLFYLQWTMALCILLGAAVIFIGPYLLRNRVHAINTEYREQLSAQISEIQENVKAQKVIKGFSLQEAAIQKFNRHLQAFSIVHYKKNIASSQLERIPMISLLVINLTIIGMGSYLALMGHITVGSLVAFFTMYTSMGNSVFNLTFAIPAFAESAISLDRIEKLMNQPQETSGQLQISKLNEDESDVCLDQVTFSYQPNQPVLHNIDMYIAPGTTAAFVGSSGSGKSSLIQLILGFYEPDEGEIRIHGTRLQDLNLDSIRLQMGVVFQDNFLFHGTILDNIRISDPSCSLEEVILAARSAEIHDFIISLPDGYKTMVLDEGSNFSGGQRQRIAIARAILRHPPILLLDEATSALDPISEASINSTFQELSSGRTVITVTHRLAAITGSDQIFVFDRGRLIESGTHQQLIAANGYYKELWDKQNGLSISTSGQEADIDVERLSRLPFFRGIELDVLDEIRALFNTENFAPGQTIIQEGEQGEKFYLIARGRVEVVKHASQSDTESDSVRLAVLEDGDHFGEIALIENVPRTATIQAIDYCTCLTLQRKVLHYVLTHYPDIDARIRLTLQERMTS
jgi:ATP-binding cassette subfamily B protein